MTQPVELLAHHCQFFRQNMALTGPRAKEFNTKRFAKAMIEQLMRERRSNNCLSYPFLRNKGRRAKMARAISTAVRAFIDENYIEIPEPEGTFNVDLICQACGNLDRIGSVCTIEE